MAEQRRDPVIRTLALLADANQSDDIFGGWLLSQMDIASGITAADRARGRVATVAIEAMEFHLPVFFGDLISCYTEITRVGTTSIALRISNSLVTQSSSPSLRIAMTRSVNTAPNSGVWPNTLKMFNSA